jgi:hypothetical protein
MFHRPLKPDLARSWEDLPVIRGVDPAYGAGAYVLFPNLALFETANSWSTFHAIPVAPDETVIDIRLLTEPEALERLGTADVDMATQPDCVVWSKGPYSYHRADVRSVHPLASDDAMLEDVYACEAMQVGLNSPAYEVGPLSGWEDSLTFFQTQVADYLPSNR